jgi:DNA polymerase elongation subunit (family B)
MKLLLLDIETAPNVAHVWGLWNQNIGTNQIMASGYTLCWAAKWYKEKKIMFNSIKKSNEKEMIEEVHALITEADAVIHYNGTKFDMPTLNKEFVLQGMAPPAPYKQIDLLTTARRQFRFPSNKLDYVSSNLGLGSKVKHKGHDLWIKCMAGDVSAWRIMEKYNKQDVKLLEKVYDRLLPWVKNHPNHGLFEGEDAQCTNCGSSSLQKRGFSRTAVGIYQRYQCNDCGSWNRSRTQEKIDKSGILIRDNG